MSRNSELKFNSISSKLGIETGRRSDVGPGLETGIEKRDLAPGALGDHARETAGGVLGHVTEEIDETTGGGVAAVVVAGLIEAGEALAGTGGAADGWIVGGKKETSTG